MTSGQSDNDQLGPPHDAGIRRRLPPLLVAAAFIVAGGVGLFLVLSGRSTHNTTTHGTSAAATTEATAPSRSPSTSDHGPNQEATPNTRRGAGAVPTITVAQLGSFTDEASLIRKLGVVDPRTLSSAASAGPTRADGSVTVASSAVDRCEPTARGLLPRPVTDRLAVGVGAIGTRQLLVFSFHTAVTKSSPKGALLVAVDRINCYPVTVHIR